jgi:mannose-6-phosphate isomerase-like protein (cupin superfamily)
MVTWLDGLASAKANKRVQLFKRAVPAKQLPAWINFISLINTSKLRGELDLRRKFYMRVPIKDDPDLLQHLTGIKKLGAQLAARLNLRVKVLNAYVNIATDEERWPSHADPEDSLFIQCEGEVVWYLDDGEYTLQPGDAIYFPGGTMHEVVALTPRAAIILAIG